MDRPPWAFEMDGPWEWMAPHGLFGLGMGGLWEWLDPPWALGMNEPWAGMGPRHG